MSDQLTRSRGPLASMVLQAVAVVASFVVAGVVAGAVWERLWTPPQQVIDHHQIYYVDYASLLRVFSGTGLYALVALVASVVVSLVVCLLVRRHELVTLAAVVVGSAIAAWLMRVVGVALGPDDPRSVVATAHNGTRAAAYLVVDGRSPYLLWPIGALFVLAIVFFTRQQRRHVAPPAAKPGHDSAPSSPSSPETGLVSDPHG